jgi:hypothetical protein
MESRLDGVKDRLIQKSTFNPPYPEEKKALRDF